MYKCKQQPLIVLVNYYYIFYNPNDRISHHDYQCSDIAHNFGFWTCTYLKLEKYALDSAT